MCGIVGYVGSKNAVPVLVEGLKQLEYRGYDSAGVAVLNGKNKMNVVKKQGKVAVLAGEVGDLAGKTGIGHTRWATHGNPSDRNSHPHRSGKFAVVHNGIIENFSQIKERLIERGRVFKSDTDTEVIAHLLSEFYDGDLRNTLLQTVAHLQGSFAIAVICEEENEKIFVAKRNNPLIIGVGKGENFIASDIPAIAAHTSEIFVMEDDEFAEITKDSVQFFNNKGKNVKKQSTAVDVQASSLEKGEFEHFMLKEIHEVPNTIRNTVSNFYYNTNFHQLDRVIKNIDRITFVACGTAYHSAVVGKYAIEAVTRIPCDVEIASEFRYKNPIIGKNTLVVAISQSGETADTLAAAKLAKEKDAPLAVVTNVKYSSLTNLADYVFATQAGTEIGVAATKSYNGQVVVLFMLALHMAKIRGLQVDEGLEEQIKNMSGVCQNILPNIAQMAELAEKYKNSSSVFFIGRNIDYAVAMEGSLKLKEISYISSEGYAAGELKHGTIAMVDEQTLVVAVVTQKALAEKTFNAIHEVRARGAKVLVVSCFEHYRHEESVDDFFLLPDVYEQFSPLVSIIPLQAFAYYMAVCKGFDPDKPRNLAKSVTVE